MKTFYVSMAVLLAALAMTAVRPVAADCRDQHVFLNSDELKWVDAPPGLPKGAQVALLYGDPSKTGPFAVRLKMPTGYTIRPHSHSRPENLTIISGAFRMGSGDTFQPSEAHVLRAGGFYHLPAGAHHFGIAEEPTVIQVQGEGPFEIEYLNPADDPRKGGMK
jgi:quercetin dioxygenase-like cupin family protein